MRRFYCIVLFLGALGLIISCTHSPKGSEVPTAKAQKSVSRFPAAEVNSNQKISLMNQIPKISSFIQSLNGATCAESLGGLYAEIYLLDPAGVDLQELASQKDQALPGIFNLRIQLREKIEQIRQAGELTDDCIAATRNIFRASRTLEEYAAEYIFNPGKFDSENHHPLQGDLRNLLVNPKFAGFNIETGLRSGDLLMSRGEAFTSALIARLGDDDAQFSHVAVLYIDPATRKKWVIESHIEVGNIVRPIEQYLKDLNFRIVVLRQPDAELAHRSAEYVFHLVKDRYDRKDNILYDFKMKLSDLNDPTKAGDKEIFCSEMARIAYREGSQGKFIVPTKLSTFHHRNRDILDRLEIESDTSFAPGDMDVDSRFEVVAEWRDLTRVAGSRYFDAIFTKYFEWMETKNYVLKSENSFQASVVAPFVVKLRHSKIATNILKPIVKLEDKLPKNMSADILGTIAVLNSVKAPLYERVEAEDKKSRKKKGYPLTTAMIFKILDDYRTEDEAAYLKFRKWLKTPHAKASEAMTSRPASPDFHFLFSPPET